MNYSGILLDESPNDTGFDVGSGLGCMIPATIVILTLLSSLKLFLQLIK